MANNEPAIPPTLTLPAATRQTFSLAALCGAVHPLHPPTQAAWKGYLANALPWLTAVCILVDIDTASLPGDVMDDEVRAAAEQQRSTWSEEEKRRMASILVEASLAVEADKAKQNKEEALRYTPQARAMSHRTLQILGLDASVFLPEAEKNLGGTLFKALQAAADGAEKVESTRAAHSQGWGGSLGRKLATGAGVIAGGVLIGVTGGLAAPAIAGLLAPLGIGGLLAGGAAPVVLGTLFGVGGGGLAGRRVRERWKGVEEFSFLEIGAGTKATKEEVEELKAARERYKARQKDPKPTTAADTEAKGGEGVEKAEKTDKETEAEVEAERDQLEEKLLNLSLEAGTRTSIDSARPSMDSTRPSLDTAADEKDLKDAKKPPSLTATIVVPGLLTVSKVEALTAWRAICSDAAADATARVGLQNGRDVYYLRFESAMMLKAGREIDSWVTSKLKGKLKGEIIKRTVLNAYFAAVKLPLTIYGMASMSLDNTWMQAQDRANKAGRILGEVLEKRVQGERPVILIGSSLGALTVMKALLYLASLPGSTAAYVESAYLISLPSAPTAEEWGKCRSVVARRLVNAYAEVDWVLAGVVRLHEVISRAATLSSGLSPAGLAPVNQPGVQDIDIGGTLKGHMELQTKMADIIRIIDVDG